MTFQASQIGTDYDVGLAVRTNPDGSTTALSVLNEDGATVSLTQVAFMFLTDEENEEAVDLGRKDRLVRLSSANVIDREFTNFPQATQGNWIGGETQRVFTDPTAYYQGRGLIWPIGSFAPSKPIYATQTIASTTGWPGVVAGGVYNGKAGYAVAYSTAGGAFLRFVNADGTSVISAALSGVVSNAIIVLGQVFFVAAGSTQVQTMSGAGPVIANFANPPIGTGGGLMAVGTVGAITYLAVYAGTSGASANTILIYNANLATSVVSVSLPAGTTLQSMAFLGSALVFVVTDQFNNSILSYDIPSATTTTVVQLQGYATVQIGAVSGVLFLACATTGSTPAVDCFLLVGSSLQFIATIPAQISGTNPISYVQPAGGVSNIAVYGPYALFNVPLAAASSLYAYDVQRGAMFLVNDQLFGTTVNNGLAVTAGLSVASPTGVAAQWTVVYQASGGNGSVAVLLSFGVPLAGSSLLIPSGRIISSAIDFTSASNKLYRQLVVVHAPIPAGGSCFVAVWLDQDVDNLNAVPDFSTINSTAASSSTTLSINKIARKLVYLVDYVTPDNTHNAPRPKSVAIQPAPGWVYTLNLALSDSAMVNGENPQQFCFTSQDKQLDALAARNFMRNLWRQRGGLCVVTYADGDTYNAVIADYRMTYRKAKTMIQPSDRKVRYEGKLLVKIQEDV